jgi:hypothetical protein
MRKFQVTALLVLLLACADAARAQVEHVYLLKMFDCGYEPYERSQTGFRVRGTKGIVTALHGVADCGRITVSSKLGRIYKQPFTVQQADVDHDAALISSPELDQETAAGLEPAGPVSWSSVSDVVVYGHPFGIDILPSTMTLRKTPLVELRQLLPPEPLSILRKRQSPYDRVEVLSIQGHILPGHSGAPILDPHGRVLGVANGGLKGGSVEISWAMPLRDIDWETAGSSDRLKALSRLNPNVLFAAEVAPADLESWQVGAALCSRIPRLVSAGRVGFRTIVGEPGFLSLWFRTTLDLPGATASLIFPRNGYVAYTMFESNNSGRVKSRYLVLTGKLSECFPDWEKREDEGWNPKSYKIRPDAKSPMVWVFYNDKPSAESGGKYMLYLWVVAPSSYAAALW